MSTSGSARKPRFCHLCGARLTGRYYRYDTMLVVCASCQAARPRCARCGVPLAGAGASPRLCDPCASTVPHCAGCDDPILGVWYTFEELLPSAAVRHFCPRCVQHRPRCDLCRAPVAEGIPPLPDGQLRCALCAADMALAERDIQAIYAEALAAFREVVEGDLRTAPRLEVVGRRAMGDLRRQYGQTATSANPDDPAAPAAEHHTEHHVLGFFVHAGGTNTIYAELGLPRDLLLGTLAHELGHAWQAERTPRLRDPLLCEGFAEWAAHRVLLARGLQAVAARATRRDDVYGRGLRHFLEIERTRGREGVLARARGEEP